MNDEDYPLMANIRQSPRETQETAFENGLMHYDPGDRADDSTEE